ncbi:MAG: hypothetical protein E7578_01850 [Ruminococcaceae bacterium]|nr:hypothetical protein [Oscillospiraceae bacterium]
MKKILSLVLAMLMLVGTFTIGAVAADGNKALKFDDTVMSEGGGNVGMGAFDIKDLLGLMNPGYTVSMDFTFGREGGPCYHPTDLTLKHTSKFAVVLGESEGNYKYVGYSATEDMFFVATCPNFPVYGEGIDGLDYLATSEKGLVKPGVTYKLAFEFIADTGINIYLDGKCVVSFDLYEDLDYATYFAHQYFMLYPTHITCIVDNVAAYAAGVYDPETGEGADSYKYFSDFEDAKMVTSDVVDDEGNVTGTTTVVDAKDWQLTEAYSLVDASNDIYGQPQPDVEEGRANVIFQSWLDKKANGPDEIFSSGSDFKIALTIKNNTGLDSLELDLLNDQYITVKEVVAADGLTAKLDGSKLTITGSGYKGEALATITYNLSAETRQEYYYRYGANVNTVKATGSEGVANVAVTNGISKVYNYTKDDLNDDGKYNLLDVVLVLKIIAKWELPGIFREAGDINDDGRINSMDASYYLRWIAGWKGYEVGGKTIY